MSRSKTRTGYEWHTCKNDHAGRARSREKMVAAMVAEAGSPSRMSARLSMCQRHMLDVIKALDLREMLKRVQEGRRRKFSLPPWPPPGGAPGVRAA